MVYFVSSSGARKPLFKLARSCRYRIDMLCEELDVSPRHFRRLFSKAFGVCPKSWLKSERMVFARNLLRGSLTIKEVSKRLGFNDQKDFYREFRACYGISPTEFRIQETERIMRRLSLAG